MRNLLAYGVPTFSVNDLPGFLTWLLVVIVLGGLCFYMFRFFFGGPRP